MRYSEIITNRFSKGKFSNGKIYARSRGGGTPFDDPNIDFLENDDDGIVCFYDKILNSVLIKIPETHPWYNLGAFLDVTLRGLRPGLSSLTVREELREKRDLANKIVLAIGEEYWKNVEPGAKYRGERK